MCLHGISWQRAPLSLLSPLVVISQVWTAFPEPCAVPAVPGCSAAGDRCHSALVQVLDTEPAAEPLPSPQPSQLSLQLLLSDFPAASATPCCSRGPLAGWLCGNAGQCRCCCSCAVPGCAPPVGGERRGENPLPKLRGLRLDTGPPAHVQKPSAKWCFHLKFLPCSPSVPTPRQLQLLYRFSSQSTLQVREKLAPFILPRTAPSPSQRRCHPPSHRRVLPTLSQKLNKK